MAFLLIRFCVYSLEINMFVTHKFWFIQCQNKQIWMRFISIDTSAQIYINANSIRDDQFCGIWSKQMIFICAIPYIVQYQYEFVI